MPINLRISCLCSSSRRLRLWIVIDIAAMAVGIDVDVEQPHLALLDARKAVAQVGLALADPLDLGAEQRDAGLEGFEDVVVVKRLAVVGDRLYPAPSPSRPSAALRSILAFIALCEL